MIEKDQRWREDKTGEVYKVKYLSVEFGIVAIDSEEFIPGRRYLTFVEFIRRFTQCCVGVKRTKGVYHANKRRPRMDKRRWTCRSCQSDHR